MVRAVSAAGAKGKRDIRVNQNTPRKIDGSIEYSIFRYLMSKGVPFDFAVGM